MGGPYGPGTIPRCCCCGERTDRICRILSLYLDIKQPELWRDGADRSFCRVYLEERNGPEAQMAMAVRNRCDNGCAGLPVIKKIWTSSMVLVSSGYCFLLMGLFYYWIDYKGHRKNLTWLKVYGMNSIMAYMLANVISFRCIGTSLFHGLEQYTGNYYPALIAASNALIIYVILWLLYKRNIFLKV